MKNPQPPDHPTPARAPDFRCQAHALLATPEAEAFRNRDRDLGFSERHTALRAFADLLAEALAAAYVAGRGEGLQEAAELLQQQRLRRYGELVDKKHLHGLEPGEVAEMEHLRVETEAYYEPFYRPIIARLRALGAGEPNQP